MSFRSQKLINADDTLFIFIDHQPQMAFGVTSIDRQTLKNNTVALAKSAKLFGVPIILTAVSLLLTAVINQSGWAAAPASGPISRT